VSKDLIDWLRAQFDVDERVARAAQDLERDVFDGTGVIVMHAATGTRSVTLSSAVAIHIADHDPARVLREVEAFRKILEQYEVAAKRLDRLNQRAAAGAATEHEMSQRAIEGIRANESYKALRLVAAIFSDRPGYREEWRPQ
jgi:hypothetical protein